jgi:outer membrane protein TolC
MRKALLPVVLVAAVGCGGGGAKYHVRDESLAAASVQEKQGVLAAQQEKEVARTEQQKAEADLRNIENELSIAENDYKSAKLQLDTAKLNVKTAETSGDVNRKNQATHDLRVQELGVKAADTKVDWLSKKRKWIKAQRDAAEEHYAAADARLELEKAKLAQQKGIKPSEDFNLMNFETDNLKKQQKYSEARGDADKMQVDVDRLERDWHAQLSTFEQAKAASH